MTAHMFLSHQLTSRAAPTHSLIRCLLQSYHCRQKDHPRPRGSPSSCLPLARPRRASTGCRSQRFASTGCAVCRDTLRAARGPHREHRLPAQRHNRVKTRRCCHHGALAVTRRRGDAATRRAPSPHTCPRLPNLRRAAPSHSGAKSSAHSTKTHAALHSSYLHAERRQQAACGHCRGLCPPCHRAQALQLQPGLVFSDSLHLFQVLKRWGSMRKR
jgi:hypothetical protein